MDITLLSLSDCFFFFTTVMMLRFSVLGDTIKAASAKDLWGSAVRIEASVRCAQVHTSYCCLRILGSSSPLSPRPYPLKPLEEMITPLIP